MAITYGPSKVQAVQGQAQMSCQHSLLCSFTLLKGPGKTIWMGRTGITEEQGRAISVGLDSKQCVGRVGQDSCRDVSGLLALGAALEGAQPWGRTREALLWLC